MKRPQRSYIAFMLLVVTFFLTVGSYGVMYVLKLNIRMSVHAMIKTLPDEELVPIEKTFSPGAETEDEIVFQGRFYDVAKYTIKGNRIVYYCYYDKEDTNLADFAAHWHDLNNIKDKRKQLAQLFKIQDFKYLNPFVLQQVYLSQRPVVYPNQKIILYLVLEDVCTPPPQILA